jgi:hypothetical protein
VTRWRKPVLCVLVVALLASCGGGGGGGSDKVDPKTYVHSVCGAVLSWVNSAKQGSTQLQQVAGVGTSPADAKAALANYMDSLVQKTQSVLSQLQNAGVPDVPNGESVSSAFTDAFQRIGDAFAKARDSISSISTTSQAAFRAAAQNLATTLQTSLQGIGSSLNKIGEDPSLVTASKQDQNCQQLGSGSL